LAEEQALSYEEELEAIFPAESVMGKGSLS
jgi:hypothetical protein